MKIIKPSNYDENKFLNKKRKFEVSEFQVANKIQKVEPIKTVESPIKLSTVEIKEKKVRDNNAKKLTRMNESLDIALNFKPVEQIKKPVTNFSNDSESLSSSDSEFN